MDEILKLHLGTSVFSVNYLKCAITFFGIFFVIVISIVRVVGEATTIPRVILSTSVLTLLCIVLRRFIITPFNMLLFYTLTMGIVALICRLPLQKSLVGVVFSLLLSMLSSVTITMNLFIYTNIGIAVRDKFNVFLLVSLTEVTFNLIYVLLASRYENLNLSFLFSEEKSAKA